MEGKSKMKALQRLDMLNSYWFRNKLPFYGFLFYYFPNFCSSYLLHTGYISLHAATAHILLPVFFSIARFLHAKELL